MSNGEAHVQVPPDQPMGHGSGSIREIIAYFLRLGTLGFGGPVALCGLMEKDFGKIAIGGPTVQSDHSTYEE